METTEIKITPPEGYEIDRENSTFDCIKFKPAMKRWRDNKDALITGYIISINAKVGKVNFTCRNDPAYYDIFATKKQAKSALAMARISQIMANDERFGGIVTDEEWKTKSIKYTICRRGCSVDTDFLYSTYYFLAFHTEEQRNLFLKENEDLVKDYLMID